MAAPVTPRVPRTARPYRAACVGLAALFLFAAPWPLPSAVAQSPGGISEEDPTGDVRVVEPSLGPALPSVQPPDPAPNPSDGLDVTRVDLFGESGVSFLLRVGLKDLGAELKTTDAVSNGIIITTCFTWDGTLYAAKVRFRLGIGYQLNAQLLGVVDGQCGPGVDVKFSKSVSIAGAVDLDLARSQVTVAVARLKLLELTGRAPAPGNTFAGLFVTVNDGNRNRFDHAPDAGPSGKTLAFQFETANLGSLSAAPVSNIPRTSCDGRRDFAGYAVQAVGTQGVPIEFQNGASGPTEVAFSVVTLGGGDWRPRIVPRLELPSSSAVGNTTVTVIVTVPAGSEHKDCAVLAVRGVTASGEIGETGVIVMAIDPPSREKKTLWLHANQYADAGADCAGPNSWLNVREDDPDEIPDMKTMMKRCRDAEVFTWTTTTFGTMLDVNPNYDLILNTSAEGVDAHALAVLRMRSDNAEAHSRLDVELKTVGGDLVASGQAEVRIGSSPKDFEIPMNVQFTRDVRDEGDPSRVVRSTDALLWEIRHRPLPLDNNVGPAMPPATVYLIEKGTRLELPVWDTIKRNANNPGEEGGLVSLRVNAELPEFAAPNQVRVINFTALNEGVDADRILVSVTMEGAKAKNWTALVLPQPPYELAPGQRQVFSVGITPRPEAEESEKVLVDVVVYSELDPTARTSIAFELKATKSGNVPTDDFPSLDGGGGDGGGLPAPGAVAFLAALGVATTIVARRRRVP